MSKMSNDLLEAAFRERDTAIRERDAAIEELHFCQSPLPTAVRVPHLAASLSVRTSEAKLFVNCLVDVLDVSVEEALVTHKCSLLGMLERENRGAAVNRVAALNSLRAHKERGVEIEDRAVPASDSVAIAGVSGEQKLAIRMYTVYEPVPYYQYLNRSLNSAVKSPRVLADSVLYIRALLRGLQALSVAEDFKYLRRVDTAYRGLIIQSNAFYRSKVESTMAELGYPIYIRRPASATAGAFGEVKDTVPFRVGDPIMFSAFTSLTEAGPTDSYADHLIYVFNDVVGLDISALSACPSAEMLLLLPPPCVFQIIKLTPMPKGVLLVHLKQVPPDASYLPFSPFPDVPHDHNLRMIFADEEKRKKAVDRSMISTSAIYSAAYKVLTTPGYARDPIALQQLLMRKGLRSSDDLQFVDKELIQNLLQYLKPIPAEKFKSKLDMDRDLTK